VFCSNFQLLTFAPTGAICAAPTFSLPEDLNNGHRNWDYRYSWLRDSAFTVYALLRLGFTEEADHYVDWLSGLLRNRNEDGSLQIM
jgi:GH15 family glucan-1,4-alpha-glucosidase